MNSQEDSRTASSSNKDSAVQRRSTRYSLRTDRPVDWADGSCVHHSGRVLLKGGGDVIEFKILTTIVVTCMSYIS